MEGSENSGVMADKTKTMRLMTLKHLQYGYRPFDSFCFFKKESVQL